jgi:hypothetical protein
MLSKDVNFLWSLYTVADNPKGPVVGYDHEGNIEISCNGLRHSCSAEEWLKAAGVKAAPKAKEKEKTKPSSDSSS